jgi:hypothetical protein
LFCFCLYSHLQMMFEHSYLAVTVLINHSHGSSGEVFQTTTESNFRLPTL